MSYSIVKTALLILALISSLAYASEDESNAAIKAFKADKDVAKNGDLR